MRVRVCQSTKVGRTMNASSTSSVLGAPSTALMTGNACMYLCVCMCVCVCVCKSLLSSWCVNAQMLSLLQHPLRISKFSEIAESEDLHLIPHQHHPCRAFAQRGAQFWISCIGIYGVKVKIFLGSDASISCCISILFRDTSLNYRMIMMILLTPFVECLAFGLCRQGHVASGMKEKVDQWLGKLTEELAPLVKLPDSDSGKGPSGSIAGFGITSGPDATEFSRASSVRRIYHDA